MSSSVAIAKKEGPPPDTTRSMRLQLGSRLSTLSTTLRQSDGFFRRWMGPVACFCEASAIGLMKPSDVDQMVAETYESRPNFYDPTRYDLDYEQRLLPVLRKYHPTGALLDAFCGQGREAKQFADAGYRVTAIDRLDWMIEAARRYADTIGFEAKFETADFSSYQPRQTFDIAYTSCWMYSTIQGAKRRKQFLRRLKALTHPQGTAVISYVSSSTDGRVAANFRWWISRTVGAITLGNRGTEFGERIYTGLFWHHLSDAVVAHEVQQVGWALKDRIAGHGLEPTFLLLRHAASEQPSTIDGV